MGHPRLAPFRPRFPWIGGDLQTLRDSLRPQALALPHNQQQVLVPVEGGVLLGWLARPPQARALVVLLHGLGGNSDSIGVKRLAALLLQRQLAVLRLNLRGAGAGRALAEGSYAACCSSDLLPVLSRARQLAGDRPLFGVGLSLGGTVLLNGLLAQPSALDGLVALSAPLDMAASCDHMQRRRNRLYLRVVLRRLRQQVAADPAGLTPAEHRALAAAPACSLTAFDAAITAPRWGYGSVAQYHADASPLPQLLSLPVLPPWLLLQAADDPWVPVAPAQALAAAWGGGVQGGGTVMLTAQGGHNGFHGTGDHALGRVTFSWSDQLTAAWLEQRLHTT
jgi:predicted alpha/beta-fold hydrolase